MILRIVSRNKISQYPTVGTKETDYFIQRKTMFGWKDVKTKTGNRTFVQFFSTKEECIKFMFDNYAHDYYLNTGDVYDLRKNAIQSL